MALRRGNGGGEALPPPITSAHTSSSLTPRPRIAARAGRRKPPIHGLAEHKREVLYVSDEEAASPTTCMSTPPTTPTGPPVTTCDLTSEREGVLAGVLANEGSDLSAHETLERAQSHVEDFTALAGRVRDAGPRRPGTTLGALWRAQVSTLFNSSRYAGARHAAHFSLRFETQRPAALTWTASSRSSSLFVHFNDAEDPASVMRARVEDWGTDGRTEAANGTGLLRDVRRAVGVTDPDMVRALNERERAMRRRAREARPTRPRASRDLGTPARRATSRPPQT